MTEQTQTQTVAFPPMTFKETNPGALGPQWYLGNEFDGAEKVTSHSSNPELGITAIRLVASNNPQNARGVGRAYVELLNGAVSFDGWINQVEGGGLRFNASQVPYTDVTGEKKYADVVRINKLIAAQILRYAHAHMMPLSREKYAELQAAKLATQPAQTTAAVDPFAVAQQQPAVQKQQDAVDPFAVANNAMPF